MGRRSRCPPIRVDDVQTGDQETEGETDGQETEADAPETPEEPAAEAGMQLSRTDFTLSSAGSKYQLKATGRPGQVHVREL